jgi:twitching motility protein PilT
MYSAIQTGQTFGMKTLDQDLARLLQEGVIDRNEARNKAANKDNF